jgi:hypothetical protein
MTARFTATKEQVMIFKERVKLFKDRFVRIVKYAAHIKSAIHRKARYLYLLMTTSPTRSPYIKLYAWPYEKNKARKINMTKPAFMSSLRSPRNANIAAKVKEREAANGSKIS